MGVHMTIVILPTKGQVYREVFKFQSSQEGTGGSGFADAVLSICEQMSLSCRDSLPYLREEARRLWATQELLWWRDDTHMNERGHQALASLAIQELSQSTP